jgi:hypothetical protein
MRRCSSALRGSGRLPAMCASVSCCSRSSARVTVNESLLGQGVPPPPSPPHTCPVSAAQLSSTVKRQTLAVQWGMSTGDILTALHDSCALLESMPPFWTPNNRAPHTRASPDLLVPPVLVENVR